MELMDQGKNYLGVALGKALQGTALTRLLALKLAPGWIVKGEAVSEWRFEGVKELEGTVYLYGPHAAGKSLAEVVALPLEKALPFVGRLTHALVRLSEASIPWFPLQSDAIIFTDPDGVLFLPPDLHREIRDLRTYDVNRETFEGINHPDLKDERQACFSVASILYRLAAGRFPFNGVDAEEMHEQARKLQVMAPARIVPELLPEVSELIMNGLGRGQQKRATLAEWDARLSVWRTRKLFRDLVPEEREKILRETEADTQGRAKHFRRRMFWEKNWKIVAIVAVVVAALGGVFGSILKNALAPRVTRGYAPEKVVTTFYESMNSLDHMTMQACVINKAGSGEVNEATTLFVTSRVTQGYEGRSNVLSAAEWDKAGRPTLVSPSTLYGVTGLSITREQGEPSPVYRVAYDKWNPAGSSDTDISLTLNSIPLSEGHHVTDRVSMKKDKDDWVIFKIDRLSADPLPAPKVEATPAPGATGASPGRLGSGTGGTGP